MSRCRPFWAAFSAIVPVLGTLPVAPPTAAQPASMTVTSLADSGACPSLTTCTLRGALASNAASIEFAVTGTILLSSPLLVSSDVAISGPGAASLAIDGQDTTRIFLVDAGRQVTMDGLTLQRGNSSSNGGAITSQAGSTVKVRDSVIKDSASSAAGGAIYNDGGSVDVRDSTLSGNSARNTGGAIHNTNGGAVALLRGTLSNNSTTLASSGLGGGILNDGGTVNVWSSVLDGNKATAGGAVYNGDGGTLTLSRSTVSSSKATDGGAIWSNTGTVTIEFSTLNDNAATGNGGAIRNGGTLVVTNSTMSRNSAGADGGGVFNSSPGTASLTHLTLKTNTAGGAGGGIRGASVVLRNSIVVNSTGGNCNARLQSAGNNLSDTDECFAGGTKGDLVSDTPKVGPLTVNSPGTTATHALAPDSPAVDGVTFSPTDCGNTVTTDQRGVPRPQSRVANRCDIGAYELLANAPPTISSLANQTTDEDTRTPAIPFTIDDSETAGASLTVSAISSNQALVPTTGITVSGTTKSRAVRLTPAANRSGTADITLTVSDGSLEASTTFILTVNAVNDAPVNTVPAAQSTTEDTPLVFSTSGSRRNRLRLGLGGR